MNRAHFGLFGAPVVGCISRRSQKTTYISFYSNNLCLLLVVFVEAAKNCDSYRIPRAAEVTPPMKWPAAVYKAGRRGAKPPWEASYDRFLQNESLASIAMRPASGGCFYIKWGFPRKIKGPSWEFL